MARTDNTTARAESKANIAVNATCFDENQTLPPGMMKVRVVDVEYIDVEVDRLELPLRFAGGDLGLSDRPDPWIEFWDGSGKRYLTHSVEWLLQNIDLFAPGRDQDQPLACAAHHYGLNCYALMGREHAESMGGTWYAQRGAA